MELSFRVNARFFFIIIGLCLLYVLLFMIDEVLVRLDHFILLNLLVVPTVRICYLVSATSRILLLFLA